MAATPARSFRLGAITVEVRKWLDLTQDKLGQADCGSGPISSATVAGQFYNNVWVEHTVCDVNLAEVQFVPGGDCGTFSSLVGLTDHNPGGTVATASVDGDGETLASQNLAMGSVYELNVDLSGVSDMWLMTTSSGSVGDAWPNAQILCNAEPTPPADQKSSRRFRT